MSVTQSESIAPALAAPFPESDIEWRIARSGMKGEKPWGMCLAYLTNRAIMDRLDAVMGPADWRNEFREWGDKAVLCGISLRLNDEWVTKWDGADQTDIEAAKGGFSNAMKRAAVQWGIGRYLYNLEGGWATFHEGGEHSALVKRDKEDKGQYFKWSPPKLPSWALPKDGKAVREQLPAGGSKGATAALPTDFSQKPAALTPDPLTFPGEPGHKGPTWKGKPMSGMTTADLVGLRKWFAKDGAKWATKIDEVDEVLADRSGE